MNLKDAIRNKDGIIDYTGLLRSSNTKVDTIDAVDMHALIQQLQKDRKTYKLKSVSKRNLKVHR
jgi:hypothetical protein